VRVLYVTDSPTVSGAEHVWFGYLPSLTPPAGAAHVFLDHRNPRLIKALDTRRTPYTLTSSFSRQMIQVTASPGALLEFGRAFSAVRRELRALIRGFRPDVVHSISVPACLYAATACRPEGVPQVWHEHNIKRIHAVNTQLYRYVASSCAWIVGPSKAVTDNLAKAGLDPRKLVPLYNGIDLRSFSPDDGRAQAVRAELGFGTAPVVGLFGQLLPHKGHMTLIDAAPAIRAQVPDAKFVFVGALENPPYEAQLRERIAAAGLTDAFVFTGWRTDVPHVMRAVDVSVVATTTQEPAALSLMETMSMGRPIVATRTGGTPEIVEDGVGGLIFPPGDAAALAALVGPLLRDPVRRAAMGAAGRARMEQHFTVERHVAGMMDLYRRAAESWPARRA
jgi:glycosyltransferase involved in cell wall biosynthesis